MMRMFTRWAAMSGGVVGLCLVAQAGPVVVVTPAGSTSVGTVLKIEKDVLRWTSPMKKDGTEEAPLAAVAAIMDAEWWTPTDDVVAIRRRLTDGGGASAAERAGLGLIEFTNGERIVGALETGTGETLADEVTWTHRLIGTRTFELDQIVRIKVEGPGAGGVVFPKDKDAVALANGDVLAGFVERIGPEVWIKPDGAGAVVKTPIAKVREVRLANPKAAPAGAVVWLEDGSIVACERASLVAAVVPGESGVAARGVLKSGKDKGLKPLGYVRALVPDAARVAALSSLRIVAQAPASDRLAGSPAVVDVDADAPLGVCDVGLPGPMSVEWALPSWLSDGGTAGAMLLGWITLEEGAHEWGNCVVSVSVDDAAAVLSERIDSARPVVALKVGVPAGAKVLKVVVQAGERGSVQDRVVLRRVMIARAAD